MASSRVPEREVREERSRTAATAAAAAAAAPDPRLHKHSALIIVGRTAHLGARAHAHISSDIHRGFQSWDIDLGSCDLNLHLQEFLSHHTASFKGAGQTCLRHSSRALDTQVLIGPSQEQAHAEVLALLSGASSEKLLILSGQSVEESGDLLFYKGHFSPKHLKHILTEQFIHEDASSSSSSSKLSLTLSCPNIGGWRATLLEPLPVTLHINPAAALPAMEALGEFTSLISASLSPPSTFELLPPPTTVGFLKLSRPCCYVFPAGRGDCAFFAVNGFTMLVDGGSDAQACFWKLVRHLDRVDAVLLTHVGTENLPGVNAFLERKVAELELRPEVKEDASKRLISPELGVVFFNAPCRLQVEQQPCVDNVLKTTQQAALTLQLLKKLDIRPQPMFRPQGIPIEPLTLFQKMGVGQLDLYILSPGKSSQEYQTFMQNWPDSVSSASKSQSLPLAALASVCALLVWHPACPQEKVVRVLFPGVTPQTKLLQGLEKLKGLAFLQKPTVTGGDMDKLQGEDRAAKRMDSQESSKSQGKDATSRHGKEKGIKEDVKEKGRGVNGVGAKEAEKSKLGPKLKAATAEKNKKAGGKKEENGVVKSDLVKKESFSSKPKSENKTKLKKDARNDSKTGAKKTRKPSGNDGKKSDSAKPETPEVPATENQKKEPDQVDASKTSTPEDMTADFLQLQEEAGNEKIQGGLGKVPSLEGPEAKEAQGPVVDPETRPAKVVGFPSPLNNCEDTAPLDLTPTEYTLLDGALRHSPPSRASPENQAPVSPEEATVEQTSPDSRPNSAGHTPYCLSPDDVWCNRDTLNRIQAQMAEPEDARQSEGPQTKNPAESHGNPKEKHLSFLSFGSLRDGCSDPSPSLATTTTTTTTHSMPAEVSSPQSTEVDESLSMSFEQGPTTLSQREGEDSSHHSHSNGGGHFTAMTLPMKKPPRSSGGSEMGRPPAPGSLPFETSPHDVDLCLVSPCEFKHFKAPDSSEASRGGQAPQPHLHGTNNNTLRDTTPSDSNAPVCTEDCPSTTADGVLDSDEDESCSEPTNSPLASQALPPDPLPVPLRDSPPLPPHPDTAMPVPQTESDGKRAKAGAMRGKKTPAVVEGLHRSGSGKNRIQSSVPKGTAPSARTPASSARSAPAKPSSSPGSKSGAEVSVYVDLAYVPSGASCPSVSVDFFRCVRSSCYIISGDGPERTPELMRQTLDALLDGKMCWSDTMQVTVIPTFESASMQEWYQHTLERQRELGITVLGSNSTVAMQDETFPACKIEF